MLQLGLIHFLRLLGLLLIFDQHLSHVFIDVLVIVSLLLPLLLLFSRLILLLISLLRLFMLCLLLLISIIIIFFFLLLLIITLFVFFLLALVFFLGLLLLLVWLDWLLHGLGLALLCFLAHGSLLLLRLSIVLLGLLNKLRVL